MFLRSFMQKALLVPGSLLLTLVATDAEAAIRTGWERPIQKAEMGIIEAKGHFSSVKTVELVMTQQDGHRSPTGLVVLIDRQWANFEIRAQGSDGCLSTYFLATAGDFKLRLVDHSSRICTDYQPHLWEALLVNGEGESLEFSGNPVGVMVEQ